MNYRDRGVAPKDRTVGFKVSYKEKLEIEKAARLAKMNKSEFIVYCIYKEIESERALHSK